MVVNVSGGAYPSIRALFQTNVNMPTVATPAVLPVVWPVNTIAPPGVCFFNFYDNGGPTVNYSAAQGGVMAFCPSYTSYAPYPRYILCIFYRKWLGCLVRVQR